MNSIKFNFYKNTKYFLVGFGVIMLAGLIVGLILGLNLTEALGRSAIVYFSLALLIVMIVSFIYLTVRYDSLTAFCFILSLFLNIATMVALVAILRIPVGDSFISALCVISGLTFVYNLVLFSKIKNHKHEKNNRDIVVNTSIKESLSYFIFVTGIVLFAILLCLAILDASVYLFVRPMLIGLVVCLISSIFISGSIWGYFYKDRPKKVKVKDETVYVEEENK